MKAMKKIILGVLSAVMLCASAAGLSGCGGASSNTLTWIQLGDRQPNHDKILAEVNKIIEPELGMKLNIEYIDTASFNEKSKLKMASGDKFDVIWAGYLNDYHTAVSLEGLMDITDYLDDIAMQDGSSVKMSDAVEEFYINSAKVNGRIYGIPNAQINSNPFVYMMRKSIVDECGVNMEGLQETALKISDAKTAQDYVNMLTAEFAKVREKRPGLYTVNPGYNVAAKNVYEEILGGVGIRKDGTTNDVVIINDTEEYKVGVDAQRDWFEKGYIRNDIASAGPALPNSEDEKQCAFIMTSWKPGQDAADAENFGEEMLYTRFEEPYITRTNPLATMLAVGANSKHPEEAVKFIYMMNSNKELYNLLCWGIEGENYSMEADGTISEIPNSGYNGVGDYAWRYGNQFNSFIYKGQAPDTYEQMREMNNTAKKSPALGFVPDTSAITTEIANITNVNDEYKAKIEYGTAARADYWDEYMSKLKSAGIEKVRSEIQRQYDEYLASKK